MQQQAITFHTSQRNALDKLFMIVKSCYLKLLQKMCTMNNEYLIFNINIHKS